MATPKQNGAVVKFSVLEHIIYPPHGVGQIELIEEQDISGYKLELYIIHFPRDKMYVKVPVERAQALGLRKLAKENIAKKALDIIYSKVKIKRSMWAKRAQEYETKLSSGDLLLIAEIIRDLYKIDSVLTQSYSERQIYEAALDRLAREISLVLNINLDDLVGTIEAQLALLNTKKPSLLPNVSLAGAELA